MHNSSARNLTSTIFVLALVLGAPLFRCQADTITFPSGDIPFSSLDYISKPDPNGYLLVVGTISPDSLSQFMSYLNSLPALSGNQPYSNASIELAPGLFFSNVMVPTTAERQGLFEDFGGLIYNPYTFIMPAVGWSPVGIFYNLLPGEYLPFAGNDIPTSLLGDPFAFRLGPSDPSAAAPEPAGLLLIGTGFVLLGLARSTLLRRSRTSSAIAIA
ncbi:MAG TPA: hypothetical protein VGG97_07100 [Bryobacteraceae bacterium]|jgi:hypothetical protein